MDSQLSCTVGESSGNPEEKIQSSHPPRRKPSTCQTSSFSLVFIRWLLKVLRILPVMKVENERYENGRKRLKAHRRNTLTGQRSSSLALLNMHFDVRHDLDLMVDTYIKLYRTKSELPTDNSESVGNTRETFKMRSFSLIFDIEKKSKKFERKHRKAVRYRWVT